MKIVNSIHIRAEAETWGDWQSSKTATELNENRKQHTHKSRGGDLGGLVGRSPKSLRWGTAHALVPQYLEK